MKNISLSKMACSVFAFCVAMLIPASAQITFTTLANFDSTTGVLPYGTMVQGLDGNLYGTTFEGGANCSSLSACGTIFKITLSGTLTNLYSFCSLPNCADGNAPESGLFQAIDGNLYGTTTNGGTGGKFRGGTLFKIDPAGSLSTLYSFCSDPHCRDGGSPLGGLIQASDGSFYGTTTTGGGPTVEGTVFKFNPSGNLKPLYSFCSQPHCADGHDPTAALLQAPDGNFYGTTEYGGAYDDGTVFKIGPDGALTTLYSFCAEEQTYCPDGSIPGTSALALADDGGFYGTTQSGGIWGSGTAFRISRNGTLTTLHSFCRQLPYCPDGGEPLGVIQATDGNFYGTTPVGGSWGTGAIFKMTPQGSLTALYSFCSQPNCADGSYPAAGLVQATDGNLYGTTTSGPTPNYGVVFRLSLGLAPFFETLPTIRQVGTQVFILGNNLTGSTAVIFNGTAATFTVVSDTEITTTVPTGATTGFVTVTSPSGTLTSNKPFRVIP